jgi:hypothetical protein
MSPFELQKPGWLLIMFLALALAAPFLLALRFLYRLIKVAPNDANGNKDEETFFAWWRYFIQSKKDGKAPEAVGYVGNNGI